MQNEQMETVQKHDCAHNILSINFPVAEKK